MVYGAGEDDYGIGGVGLFSSDQLVEALNVGLPYPGVFVNDLLYFFPYYHLSRFQMVEIYGWPLRLFCP